MKALLCLGWICVTACGGSSGGGAPLDGGSGGSSAFGGTGGFGGGAATSGAGGAGATGPGVQPPAPDLGAPTASGTSPTTLAVSLLLLGETTPALTDSPNAWRDYGYDVDGQISSEASTYHCQPLPGTPKSNIQTDGTNGIDNSFGANLMSIMQAIIATPTQDVVAGIQSGQSTLLFHLTNLDPSPNQNGALTRFYAGAPTSPPTWNGDDLWPVTFESVNGSLDQPKLAFPDAYVVGWTWVSGSTPATAPLVISLGSSFPLPLVIHHARISMQLSGTGQSATATAGTISGVLNTQELIQGFQTVAGSLDVGFCEGPTFDSIAQQLAQASDVLADGTQDPTKTCDGISIGLGFEAKAVQLGSVAPPVQPPFDPCN